MSVFRDEEICKYLDENLETFKSYIGEYEQQENYIEMLARFDVPGEAVTKDELLEVLKEYDPFWDNYIKKYVANNMSNDTHIQAKYIEKKKKLYIRLEYFYFVKP